MGWFSTPLGHSSRYFHGSVVPSLPRFESFSRCNPSKLAPVQLPSNFPSDGEHQHDLIFFPSSFHSPINLYFFSALPSIAVQGPRSFLPHSFHRSIHCLNLHSLFFFASLCALLDTKCLAEPQLRETLSCRRRHRTQTKPNHVLGWLLTFLL